MQSCSWSFAKVNYFRAYCSYNTKWAASVEAAHFVLYGVWLVDEVLGVFGVYGFVEVFDDFHVFFDVACGGDDFADANFFVLVVDEGEGNGDVGFCCDVVEAFFPFGSGFASAFWGDGDAEVFSCGECFCHLVGG